MKVLMVSKASSGGGAALAAYRLMLALRKQDADVKMLVQEGGNEEEGVFATSHGAFKRLINFMRFVLERLAFLPHEKSPAIRFLFSLASTGEDLTKNPHFLEADIIHLHWINAGFLSLRSLRKILKSGKPVVWTFHDEWIYTGGCHLALECQGFTRQCGACPYLRRPGKKDLSSRIWKRKERLFRNFKFHVIAPSSWLLSRVQSSSLLGNYPVDLIPNLVDTNMFRPTDRDEACRSLGLDADTRYILFGAPTMTGIFKGFEYFREAAAILKRELGEGAGVEILLFGKSDEGVEKVFPLPATNAGRVNKAEDMAALYSVADVFVNPSLQESFGYTILESMLCGTPVVGFNTGAISEIIQHKINGYLAAMKSAEDLAAGILWILRSEKAETISKNARSTMLKKFQEEEASAAHISLYKRIISGEEAT